MKIKAYFFFPETDDDFIRIGDDPETYKYLIEEVAVIKKQLKANKEFELWYDLNNVQLFLAKAESLIDGKYLAKCRTQLQTLFGNSSQNINNPFHRKNDCIYVNWNINLTFNYANPIFSEASEAKWHEGHDKTIIINISNAYITNRENVHVIIDAIHHKELPKFITIPIVNNEIEFSEWHIMVLNSGFSLKGNRHFSMTPFLWIKQHIYLENSTGNYWYYDYFHKDNKIHFEVFDPTGIHLGEANIAGILDSSKACNTKRIDHLIQ